MLEFLIDNILYIWYVWWTYLSTNSRNTYGCKLCSSSCRLVPLFEWGRLHTRASREKEKKLARSFNFTFRYIDDVLSLNNSRFGDFVDCIYPIELEIKDAIDTDRSPSYFDLLLGYVPLVVNRSRSFPHSCLITRFVTRLTQLVPLVEQELLILPEHLSSPSVLVGFVLLDL